MAFRTIFTNTNAITHTLSIRSSNFTSITIQNRCNCLKLPNFVKNLRYQNVREFRQTRNFKRRSNDPTSRAEPGEYNIVNTGGFSCLVRPFGFAVGVTAVSFAGAAIAQYEKLRLIVKPKSIFDTSSDPTVYGEPDSIIRRLSELWNNFDAGQKVGVGIIAANFVVFGLWRIPVLRGVMQRYFSSNPMTGAPCLSMLLSSYSHYSFLHFAMNMYVMWSFIPVITRLLGPEQFFAFYTSAAVWSSFASYAYRVSIRSLIPSVGASGAIIAILGGVCYYYPDSRLSIAFVGEFFPHSFSAQTALMTMVGFDTLGLLLKWRIFDHAAHLGGVMFGVWYLSNGNELIWKNREPLMKIWHDIRGRP